MTVLDQCEAAIDDIKALMATGKWDKLVEYLRIRVLPLLVTEEDLRRSGIGKMLARIVKNADGHAESKRQAQEIIEIWKDKIHHRDPELEKRDEADRIEREKFLESVVYLCSLSFDMITT